VLVGDNAPLANLFDANRYKIACAKVHPDYVKETADNDFAVLTLDRPIDLSSGSAARAACLPTEEDVRGFESDTEFLVSGWKVQAFDEDAGSFREVESSKAKQGTVLNYPQETCAAIWEAINSRRKVTDNMMCAGGVGLCTGDSGGPLTWKDSDGIVKVVGVISWGPTPCGVGLFPDVYAKVAAQLDWIQSQGVLEGKPLACDDNSQQPSSSVPENLQAFLEAILIETAAAANTEDPSRQPKDIDMAA